MNAKKKREFLRRMARGRAAAKRRKHGHHKKRRAHRKAKAHHKIRAHKRSRKRRKNPAGMPVLLVNPSERSRNPMKGRRHRKHRRHHSRNPHRRRHHRRSGRVRVHGYSRRRNPRSGSWKSSIMNTGLGLVGGGLAYAIDWGSAYAPVRPAFQAAITGVGGAVAAIGVSKLANESVGAGIAGGTGYALIQRIRVLIAQNAVTSATTPSGASGLFGPGAGRVFRGARDSAAVFRDAGAAARMASRAMPAPSFKEAGRSRYVAGPVRFFGPRSWPGASGAGVVYRSAHNTR